MKTTLTADELAQHAYALDVSGFTILRAQASAQELNELRACADAALAAADVVTSSGQKLMHTAGSDYYKGTRCLYCWGAAPLRWLEHETTRKLADLTIGEHCLWDMSALSALPTPASAAKATTSWHRDFTGAFHGAATPAYLWFFLCLDDVTAENGATWIVPGSHHRGAIGEPKVGAAWSGDDLSTYPSRMQLCGRAGDILVLNPVTLHSSGRNMTARPRRLLNVGLCDASLPPLFDQWTIAGPAIQENASAALRTLLGADRKPPSDTFNALPPNHQTARQESEATR